MTSRGLSNGERIDNAPPLFSVILTTFNRPRLLADALDSLARQSCKDFEVILVCDQGTPVEALLEGYAFDVVYLYQGRNQGPAAARNAALHLARGRYVVYLDDDDLYLPHHLHTLAQAIESHPDELVYTDAVFVTETLEGDVRTETHREQRYRHGEYSRERLFYNNYIPVNTFACPRALIAAVGGFDEALPAFEDWDLLMRLAMRVNFRHVRSETVEARMRVAAVEPERRSQQNFKDYPALHQALYARHWDLDSEIVRNGRRKMLVVLGVVEEQQSQAPGVQDWLAQRRLSPLQRSLVEQRLQQHGQGPRFGVLVLDLQGDPAKVATTQKSLGTVSQTYRNLQPVLLSVAGAEAGAFEGQVIPVTAHDWVESLNQVLAQGAFDWFCLVNAGDALTASGLLVAGLELINAPGCRALYCDALYRQGEHNLGAVLKPDFNLDYLLGLPASMGRHWLLRRDVVLEAGGFDPCYRQALEFELVLRLITLGGLDGLGHIAEPLLISDAPQLANLADERNAIAQHLRERGYEAAEVRCDKPGQYRIRYGHRQQPLVSILVLAGSELNYLQRCIESLLENTRYANRELLLIESDPAASEVSAWLQALAGLGDPRLRPLGHDPAQATQAQAVNAAAEQARGEYLLLLSPQVAAYDDEWLDELLNHAQRPEVGAVGAKLLSADGKVNHAGLILGLQGPVGRPFAGLAADAPGYMQRLQIDQNYSAVSGDCLLIGRELYLALGGLGDDVPACYQDVDLCLRAGQAGYLNVLAANAQLLLSGQAHSAASTEEENALYAKWLPLLARDTAYNPNLALIGKGGFQLGATTLSWRPLSSWKPLPTVLAHPTDLSMAAHYRLKQPLSALQQAGQLDGAISLGLMHLPNLERYEPDSIILQMGLGEQRLAAIQRMKGFHRALTVFDLDSYLPDLPAELRHGLETSHDLLDTLQRGLACADRLVVPCTALAEALASLHGDIRVVESRLHLPSWSALQGQRRSSAKPRVGLTGQAHDSRDLLMLLEVVKTLATEVEWVFLGQCPEPLRASMHEVHDDVEPERYPQTLAGLNLDLMLAPRAQTRFNDLLSNVQLLEYGACGYPVICSDVLGYRTQGLPVTRVGNRDQDWLEAIRSHLSDLDAAGRLGDELQAVVRSDWMLDERHLQAWRSAWLAG